jgi:hypothetical protein
VRFLGRKIFMADPKADQRKLSRTDYAGNDTAELIKYYTVERDSFELAALNAIAAELEHRGVEIKKFFCGHCGGAVYFTAGGEIGDSARCRECGAFNPVPDVTYEIDDEQETAPRDSDSTDALEPGQTIEILLPPGEKKVYRDMDRLREDILSGNLKKSWQARMYKVSKDGNLPKKMPPFSNLETAVTGDSGLHQLYKPIWACTRKYLIYGVLIGIALKFLEATAAMFSMSGKLGGTWLVVCLALLAGSRFKLALIIAVVVGIITKVNIFAFLGTAFGIVLMGAIFGGPAGMIIGTIVGYFRAKSIQLAPDHEPEGARPYLVGILVPAAILAIGVLLYLSAILKLF